MPSLCGQKAFALEPLRDRLFPWVRVHEVAVNLRGQRLDAPVVDAVLLEDYFRLRPELEAVALDGLDVDLTNLDRREAAVAGRVRQEVVHVRRHHHEAPARCNGLTLLVLLDVGVLLERDPVLDCGDVLFRHADELRDFDDDFAADLSGKVGIARFERDLSCKVLPRGEHSDERRLARALLADEDRNDVRLDTLHRGRAAVKRRPHVASRRPLVRSGLRAAVLSEEVRDAVDAVPLGERPFEIVPHRVEGVLVCGVEDRIGHEFAGDLAEVPLLHEVLAHLDHACV